MRFAYEYIKKIIETTSLDAPVLSVVAADGKTTIEVIELQHIAVGRVVAIDGVKYLVESVNYDNATFTVSGEILEPKIVTYPEINFVHGTAAMVNAEIQARKSVGNKANLDEKQRYPLLWMVEIYSQKTGGKADNFDIESDIKLVLLDDVKSNKLTTDQHYTNVINGQKQLWDWLLSVFAKHKTIVKNENFDISNDIRETAHTNFGRFQNDKGHTTHILDENISGLEIELSNVRFKLNQCKQLFETVRCIPVTIYQTIMSGGIQKVNLLSDLNSKSVDDSVYFVVEKGRFYFGVPDGSTYAIDNDYTTSSSDAAPAAWVWIDIASKSNGFFIADSVAFRNALPENLRRKGHVCSLLTVDKYVLYAYQGDNGLQVNWSNDANWALLEGGQVQSDWNQTDNTAKDYIKNKPSIPSKTSDLTNDSDFVSDSDYVHTDNNFTTSEKLNLSNQYGINTGDQDLSGLQQKIPFVPETNNEYLRDDGTFQAIEMPVGGYANNLYFSETASDVNGYETLSYTPESNTTIEAWTVNASEGEKVLKSYLYPSQVGVNYLNSGLWSFQFYGKVSASNGVTNLGVQYFRRLADNSEVNLFTLWSDEINNTSDAWIKISMTLPGYTLAITDRMGCRVLARTTHNQNITINYSVGDGYGAWINNPNKIRHSQLRAVNEDLTVQHITTAEKTYFQEKVSKISAIILMQSASISEGIIYCVETNKLYRYFTNISAYISVNNTVISSDHGGGWVEHDTDNKVFVGSNQINLTHLNQSSSYTLSSNTDFTAINAENGHVHVMKLFCNGFIPSFSGFELQTNSSPLTTIDTSVDYYHTIVFFRLNNINKYIILEKVLSNDVTPPTLTISVNSKTDTAVTFGIQSNEIATMKWALYSGGSSNKTTTEIDNGTGSLQHNTKTLSAGSNSLQITALTALTTYDLWQYSYDSVPNTNVPSKTTVQTNASGLIPLSTPVLGTITVNGTTSLIVPIAASSIDSKASSVSLFYKKSTDSTYTEITGIGKTDSTYTLSSLTANTQYNIYLVAKGNGTTYSDSANSNIQSQSTQNIAPTLGVPYTNATGTVIILPFSRAMADPSAQSNLFAVSGGKTISSVALQSGNSANIEVTVSPNYTSSDTITITISSGLLPADGGLAYGGVSNQSVTNLYNDSKSLLMSTAANYIKSTIISLPTAKTTAFSASAWAYQTSRNTVATIMALTNDSNQSITYLSITSAGKLQFHEYSAGNDGIYLGYTSTNVIPLSTWTHVAVTFDGTTHKLYINGIAETVVQISAGTFASYATANQLRIGSGKTGGAVYNFIGNLNDCCYFTRALTQDEITEIATLNSGKAVNLLTTSVNDVIASYWRLSNSNVDSKGTNTSTNVGTPVYSTISII